MRAKAQQQASKIKQKAPHTYMYAYKYCNTTAKFIGWTEKNQSEQERIRRFVVVVFMV